MARDKRSIKARTDVPATARGPNPDPNTYDDEDDPTPAPAAVAIPVADDDLFAVDEEVDDRPSATEGVVEGNDAEELETPKRPASKAGKGKAAVEAAATVGAAVARRVIALAPVGTRKLTKKQQTSLLDFRTMGKARDKRMDAIAKGIRDRLRTKNGFTGVYSGAESKDLVVGIPLPSLAFEFLLANDVLPLSIIIQLVAKWGTGKSGLVAEMFRWFDDAGGMGFHMENETKFSPEWFESIMGTQCFDRLTPQRATSIDDWQQRLTASIDAMKGAMDGTAADPGPGRTFPVMYSVDSIMGKLTAESQRKIAEEGFAGRGFPIEALAISRYLSSVPSWLDGWPFLLVLVNHLKVKQDDQGNKERSSATFTPTLFPCQLLRCHHQLLLGCDRTFPLQLLRSNPLRCLTLHHRHHLRNDLLLHRLDLQVGCELCGHPLFLNPTFDNGITGECAVTFNAHHLSQSLGIHLEVRFAEQL
jgi:hypothetical protein